jgi:DMATS type aromatic prenyltransferase
MAQRQQKHFDANNDLQTPSVAKQDASTGVSEPRFNLTPLTEVVKIPGYQEPVTAQFDLNYDSQLEIWKSLSTFLPNDNEDHQFWWKVTGRHVARMLHEAKYPVKRQVELLMFQRYHVVPRLGPRPTSSKPWFKSRIAPGIADGGPINYSWRWNVGNKKPYIRHYMEPIGELTGTPADPLNEVATRSMLHEMSQVFPSCDPTTFYTFANHLRPNLANQEVRRNFTGSNMLIGLEMHPDSSVVDIMAALVTKDPSQVSRLFTEIFPAAMRDAYGPTASQSCLEMTRDFLQNDPDGQKLIATGVVAVDCCDAKTSRFKAYLVTRDLSFRHIARVMTLGGLKAISPGSLASLRELWYAINDLPTSHPDDAPPPPLSASLAAADPHGANTGLKGTPRGLTFYFDIHPKYKLPHIKMQLDVTKHSPSDHLAADAVCGYLQRRGRGDTAQAYLNMLRGMVPATELRQFRDPSQTGQAVQAYFALAFKDGEIDITSYVLPQVYGRYFHHWAEIGGQSKPSKGSPNGQRRSRFSD